MTTPSITTPVATSKNMSCNINLPWFLHNTEYYPTEATFEPLVNGDRAFSAVYDAIMAATQSVEIVCWGFQPSMYFKRGGDTSLCIGKLLEMKAENGVKVRILCWSDTLRIASFSENMTPGRNIASIREDFRNETQRDIDVKWYRRATKSAFENRSWLERNTAMGLLSNRGSNAIDKVFSVGAVAFKNIEFVARDMNLKDRAEIAWQVSMRSQDSDRSNWNKFMTTAAMTSIPTHHQKMVLIDYETPDKAVGFVMGHNSLDAYWDNDDHSAKRMLAHEGRNGATPRQDISSRVTGPILEYLNHNFAQAWLRETGIDLLTPREHIADQLKTREGFGPKMMAQILRTQPQENKRDIREMYLKAAGNANSFMYLENQYFRWPPLAEKIKENVRRQFSEGRSLTEHGPLYLFVVTNSTKEGMGDGTINTYRMLRQLGRPELMPNVARLERNEELEAQVAQAKERYDTAKGKITIIEGTYGNSFNPAMSKLWEPQRKAAAAAEAEYRELKAKLPAASSKDVDKVEIEGLKVLVCTLVAPDSPPEEWMDVYIHSKLMIIDDVFTTLGSSNINTRSMEVDSELNICVEDPAVTKPLRKHLWSIHTDAEGAGDDIGVAFRYWTMIAVSNAARRAESKHTAKPIASLTEFRRDSDSRTNLD
ncbi:phospholipase D-like domain-containing protein [Pseudomonas syringae]|uniref:Phospholipase n=1 Tax=Pseudomonas syringae pv. syringae TaxID=321 RepID=A0AAE5S5M6_PSESY|nr:phospholipase D-like domain-containing protein [Pseudomonas syringae]MBS7422457.1 phospholipase [Pseudomonas syringae]MBS7434211.1 phospholipase [Pseudomonas syringae]POQ02251.1 phospholipase [Pseudomonas syringae pv. syringae]QVI80310.1 phospholipase [Pseudomonas syringae]UZS67640.1 phospholipase D-like domain-containing protein [Pseudomonas syringae]